MRKPHKDLIKMHPIKDLGNIPADRGDIRTERLQDRLNPKVPFPHKHDFYQIVVVTAGKGRHEVDFRSYKVVPGQVFVLKPGQVHDWTLDPKTKGFVIEFTMESLTASALVHSAHFIQKVQALPDEMKLKKELFQKFVPVFELLVKEHQKVQEDSELYRQSHLSLFLIELFRITTTGKQKSHPHSEITVQFVDLVEDHFKTEHNLKFYAKVLSLSEKALAERVRKNLGLSPKEVIQKRCVLEAKRLLVYSEFTVAEIGYKLGFEDPNYFSRFFRQETKMGAQAFRYRARKS